MRWLLISILFFFCCHIFATNQVVNVYIWSSDIPYDVIHQFEEQTGIKVNFSTYDSNEEMYAKITAAGNPGYDVIMPSTYYIDRMRKQGLLLKINTDKLSHYKELDPLFTHGEFDPKGQYSVPFQWGITGIFVNTKFFPHDDISGWRDFWQKKYYHQLVLLNDPREVFSMAFKVLGLSANDENPKDIKRAYELLLKLLPNVKVFNDEAIDSFAIDEDITIGMMWNGDFVNTHRENKNLKFIFPKDGFVIWLDSLAIPKGAPHVNNAYRFINFLISKEIEKKVMLSSFYALANLDAVKLLPKSLRDDVNFYPPHSILKNGQFQTDISNRALRLYEKYWERLKINA